jgi:hypothetical protein
MERVLCSVGGVHFVHNLSRDCTLKDASRAPSHTDADADVETLTGS